MRCQLCTSDRTTAISTGKPWQRLHCLSCGGQHYRGLAITKAQWERWVNFESAELEGRAL